MLLLMMMMMMMPLLMMLPLLFIDPPSTKAPACACAIADAGGRCHRVWTSPES